MLRVRDGERRLRVVDGFVRAMLQHHVLDDLLWNIADLVGELLGFDDCVVYMREGEVLVQAAAFGVKNLDGRHIKNPLLIPVGVGIVGSAAETALVQYVADTRLDSRYISDQYNGASELAVPLVFDGVVIGVFDSECDRVDGFSADDRDLFQLVADVASARVAWLGSERSRLASIEQQDAERLESLGLLAAGIAHDFNNLLAVVSLNVELARGAQERCARQVALDTVDEAVHRARGLTKQLSTFSRGGAPVRALLEPAPLLREAVGFLTAMPRIRCQMKLPEALPLLHADETQLAQVLYNLLLNAAEAMIDGGRIVVGVCACQIGSRTGLQIDVEDDGPGFSEHVIHRIFDPFYTTKSQGSGLGLATSYWIVRRHGGELTAANRPGGGALLRVVLPALEGELTHEEPEPERVLGTMRVLVLEDEPLVRRALSALLQRAGHHVDMVSDGVHVAPTWDQARRDGLGFDVALLDLQNNVGMGGLDALRELLAVDASARAVVMSGYADCEGMHNHLGVGFRARLEKPFDAKNLLRALSEALDDS